MTTREERFRDMQDRADGGDPNAQIALAWEYFKGNLVERSFPRAVDLFRSAESKEPRLARFNLAKAKIIENDSSFRDDIAPDCAEGFGPALFLMGMNAKRGYRFRKTPREAVEYFRLAAKSGHLISEIMLWRLENTNYLKRLKTLFPFLRLFFKAMRIKHNNPDDVRVMD